MTRRFQTLATHGDAAPLLRRLRRLQPDSPRQWGRMSAHQMVCHLSDAFLMGTARKPVSAVGRLHHRTVLKWIALYVPAPWPSGFATRPEIDQAMGGTKPAEFQSDVAALEALIESVVSDHDFFRGRRHPIFGRMSDWAWHRWAYLHVDHHLRQFGV